MSFLREIKVITQNYHGGGDNAYTLQYTIDGLAVDFTIEITVEEPAKGRISIYNLSQDKRVGLSRGRKKVELLAKYSDDDQFEQIYNGDIRLLETVSDPPNIETRMTVSNSILEREEAVISVEWKKGDRLIHVIQNAIKTFPLVGSGGTSDFAGAWNIKMPTDGSYSGDMLEGLVSILEPYPLRAIEYNKKLYLVELGAGKVVGFRLSEKTGMIGSPTLGDDDNLEVTSVFNNNFFVGDSIEVESNVIPLPHTRWQITAIKHSGGNYQNSFTTKYTMIPHLPSQFANIGYDPLSDLP